MNISHDQGSPNIKEIIRYGQILARPDKQPDNTKGPCHYALGKILQLDGKTCMLIAGMEEQEGPDLCVGSDGFIFRKLSDIKAENAIVINRAEKDFLLSDGQKCYLIKTPMRGCFVPLGANDGNNKPHPAAGKGFLYCECVPYKTNRKDPLPVNRCFIEKIDISWDGSNLSVDKREFIDLGYKKLLPSITNPVAFDDGFLAPFTVNIDAEGERTGIITAYFAYRGNAWRCLKKSEDFGGEYPDAFEPSIRYNDDGFMVCFRTSKAVAPIFLSKDGFEFKLISETWNHTVPRILNQGLDGSLYLSTNTGPGYLRNPLLCYPWNGNGFDEPFCAHDENGIVNDEGASIPFVDCGVSANVFLEGRRRHFLVYRVCDLMERTLYGCQEELSMKIHKQYGRIPIRDTTGIYISEFIY